MRALRVVALVGVLGGFVATRAAAQDARLRRLTPETRALVQPILDSVRMAGLPIDPLVERALEGTSKGAAPALIATVVRRVAADLARARGALGSDVSAEELTAGADALRAGASPAVLARLRAALGTRHLTVPIGVTADLIARGVAPDTAATLLIARARSARDTELLAFERKVDRDIALGASPLTAATGLTGAADGTPTAQVGGAHGPVKHKP